LEIHSEVFLSSSLLFPINIHFGLYAAPCVFGYEALLFLSSVFTGCGFVKHSGRRYAVWDLPRSDLFLNAYNNIPFYYCGRN